MVFYQKWYRFTASGLVSIFPRKLSCQMDLLFESAQRRHFTGFGVLEMQIKNSDEHYMTF